jgi:hypothetical protein
MGAKENYNADLDDLDDQDDILEDEDHETGETNDSDGQGGESEEDRRATQHEDNEEVDEDPDREEIRQRRRNERRLKKEKARERDENYRRELAARDAVIEQLNSRLNQIDRRNNGFDLANLDNQIQQLNNLYIQERERVAKGVEEKNGVEVTSATENMMKIRDRFNQLQATKQAYMQSQQKPQPLDPRLIQYASEWQSKNEWYKPDGKDTDSRIVRLIDDQLAQENWNPNTKEYWDELTERVKKQLPYRFERSLIPKRSSPVGGSSRTGKTANSNSGTGGYPLSPDRVQAMKDAGLWSDPEKRKKAIEGYKRYDAEHKGE